MYDEAWGTPYPSTYGDDEKLNSYLAMFYDERAAMAEARGAAPTSEWSLNVPVPRQNGALEGLALLVNPRPVEDSNVRLVQTELARLGFLFNEASREGIDGKWGPRTALALRFAAQYVGWTGPHVIESPRPPSGSGARWRYEVPDALVERLQAAPPAPPGTLGLARDLPRETTPETPPSTGSGEVAQAGPGVGGILLLAAVVAAGLYFGSRQKARQNDLPDYLFTAAYGAGRPSLRSRSKSKSKSRRRS